MKRMSVLVVYRVFAPVAVFVPVPAPSMIE